MSGVERLSMFVRSVPGRLRPVTSRSVDMRGLATGQVVAGRFRLERRLGGGGGGVVWAAENTRTGRPVALKFLHQSTAPESVGRVRMLREAKAAIDHPNVVVVDDVHDADGNTLVLVMELLEGRTLAAELAATGPLPLPCAADWLCPILSAVASAHALGYIHRDLKPDNLFVTRRVDGSTLCKVLDFGIAKGPAEDPAFGRCLTLEGAHPGTPGYSAPEQADPDKTAGNAADIFAMSVIIYECLSGCRPFSGSDWPSFRRSVREGTVRPLHDIDPLIPTRLSDVVTRGLAWCPELRPRLIEIFEVLRAQGTNLDVSFEVSATKQLPDGTSNVATVTSPAAPKTSIGRRAPTLAIMALAVALTSISVFRMSARLEPSDQQASEAHDPGSLAAGAQAEESLPAVTSITSPALLERAPDPTPPGTQSQGSTPAPASRVAASPPPRRGPKSPSQALPTVVVSASSEPSASASASEAPAAQPPTPTIARDPPKN